MKAENFLLDVVCKLEARYECIACAYKEFRVDGTLAWWYVSIDNYEAYFKDSKFRVLAAAWRKIAEKNGFKIVFCYSAVSEKKLTELLENNDLIMNV